MNNTTGVGFINVIVTALENKPNWINKAHCAFAGHDNRHTERNRDNNLRILMPATTICNRCGHHWSEKL